MPQQQLKLEQRRRGAIAVLAAVMCVVLLAMIAFAVDVGNLAMARTQLQAAADSTALAAAAVASQQQSAVFSVAQYFASKNTVAGRNVQIADSSDVQFGTWNTATRTFTPSTSAGNAVKVTVRADANNGGQTALFFARYLGLTGVTETASAIATMNPRDIAFVVDLSGSMNDDTSPASTSSTTTLMQQVFSDFGFGTYPGTVQYAGSSLTQQTSGSDWLTPLKAKLCDDSSISYTSGYKNTRYFTGTKKTKNGVTTYTDSDGSTVLSDSTRTTRAYYWVMDVQIGQRLMSAAVPTPNSASTSSYNYWKKYIDYTYTDKNTNTTVYACRQLGYNTYLQFMMYYGRDVAPDGTDYTPLSLNSSLCSCPMHSWPVGTMSFSFPPREMPTHAMRCALIAAIQVVQSCNQTITDPNQQDWVSIITFDTAARIQQTLTSNYTTVMNACSQLQACSDTALSTDTEAGLALAYSHIKPQSQGGSGRENTNKIVVFLTDGQPNLKQSTSTTISNYVSANPNTWVNPNNGQTVNNWTMTGDYQTEQQAGLMQTDIMQGNNYSIYAAGVGGASTDADATNFLNCLARMGGTADKNGNAPSGGNNPATYQDNVTQIFQNIITNPKLRLVK